MGIDKGVHVKNDSLAGFDSIPVATILSEVLKRNQYDVILFGKQAIDDDNAGVGIEVAEMLNLPHVSVVVKLEILVEANNKKAKVNRESEGKTEVYECSLPAVFTCQKGLNTPRFAPLMGIMKAKKKELENIDGNSFTVDKKIEVLNLSIKEIVKSGKVLTGEAKDIVPQLVKLLHEEAKLI
jgi:electron transfer flavoprotein beta subunit